VGFVLDKATLEQVFSEFLACPLPTILQIPLHSLSIIIQGWYNRPFSGLGSSGLGSASSQEIKKRLEFSGTE
jgi:hypothetical protein